MRKLHATRGEIRFAVPREQWQWLANSIQEIIRVGPIQGMSFTTVLAPWTQAIADGASQERTIRISPKTTITHGEEMVIATTPEQMRPLIDVLALLIDGDRPEIAHLRPASSIWWLAQWREWYGLETLWRSEMQIRYAAQDSTLPMEQEFRVAARWWGDCLRKPPGFQNNGNADLSLILTLDSTTTYQPLEEARICAFEDQLVTLLRDYLLSRHPNNPLWIRLFKDYEPQEMLKQALHLVGITAEHLPIKTVMVITSNVIEVKRGYGAPFVIIWPLETTNE